MQRELQQYLDLFGNLNNPVYYALLFSVIIGLMLYIIYTQVLIPNKKRHDLEKKELEIKTRELELKQKQLELDNLRIVGAFSDADPNPIIRTDDEGFIIYANTTAKEIFNLSNASDEHIIKLLPDLNFDFKKEISNNFSMEFNTSINHREFNVYFYGIASLQQARIYFIDLTDIRNYQNQILESEQQFKSLSFYLQDTIESEKQRLGRELHDSIGQNLHLVKMKLTDAYLDFDKYKDHYNDIRLSLDGTIDELRLIIFDLKPKALEDMGLFSSIQFMSDNINKNFNVDGSVLSSGTQKRLESKAELYMFRIIQESLSNILKHSKATEYLIHFNYKEDNLGIRISDNGVGFDHDGVLNRKSYGLLNMSERIKAVNGRMEINSSGEEGTNLFFELPYMS